MRTKPCLTAEDAHKMMAACKAEATKNKWAVTICIVDDAGNALLLERMDGCGGTSADVSLGKEILASVKNGIPMWARVVKEAGIKAD